MTERIHNFSAGPAVALKTRRTGSSLPPMPSGWISSDGRPAAIASFRNFTHADAVLDVGDDLPVTKSA